MLQYARRDVDGGETFRETAATEAGPDFLIIGQDCKGRWIVRDRCGLKAGIFGSYDSALHFAKGESSAADCTIIVSTAVIELDLNL